MGRRIEAEAIASEVLAGVRETNGPSVTGTKSTLGRLLEELGKTQRAKMVYDECARDCRNVGNMFLLNVVLTYLGDFEISQGNFEEALSYHEQALASRRELRQSLGIATSLRGIGRALVALRRWTDAVPILHEAVQRFRDENATSGHASSLMLLGLAEYHSGKQAVGVNLVSSALTILRGMTPSARMDIGPWGASILEEAERALEEISKKSFC
jgi:tetratricopeptide (TPR) repeat protein